MTGEDRCGLACAISHARHRRGVARQTLRPPAGHFGGTFTINWPVSSGFNPSTGTLGVTNANGAETAGSTRHRRRQSLLALQYVTTGNGTKRHPVTAQTFVNPSH